MALAHLLFLSGGLSRFVDGATNFDFKIRQAIITPHTNNLALQLNALPAHSCGLYEDGWQKGVSIDVTPTGGCSGLGLKVPQMELELLKLETKKMYNNEHLFLYLGQIETDYVTNEKVRNGHIKSKRPSSYQPPLVQCHEDPGYHIMDSEIFPLIETARLRSDGVSLHLSIAIYSIVVGVLALLQ